VTRDELITALAELLAGLQVPVSMEMPLGKATAAWTMLHAHLAGFGWKRAADYEEALRRELGITDGKLRDRSQSS
jgi:hypothetical protein